MVSKTLSLGRSAAGLSLGAALLVTGMQPASAALITVSRDFSGNDCVGFFGGQGGGGFDACTIFVNSDGVRIELSPVIAKYDADGQGNLPATATDINSLYAETAIDPGIDGTEYSFSNLGAQSATGDWTYTPGLNDPGTRYWVAKASNAFRLFWTVNDTATAAGGACDGSTDLYTLACLKEAVVVTSGSWTTAGLSGIALPGLSHITFYDTEPVQEVPEPVALALMGLGLAGMGMMRRRVR